METTEYKYSAVIALALVFLISGCTWIKSYAKLRLESNYSTVTIQHLKDNWRDYTVYYAGYYGGVSIKHPSAIMFDPKNDSKTLKGDKWTRVEDEETLAELISSIQNQNSAGGYYPRLWRILGPDKQFYGYLFTAWDHVVARVIEPGTMWVYDLPLPPYLAENGDAETERDTGPGN